MKILCTIIIAVILAATPANAQIQNSPVRPYAVGGLSLNGGGYQPLSEFVGGGLDLESLHFVGDVEADYDNARKTNDGTVNNKSGHERFLQGRLFVKNNAGWFAGGGAQWSQTATTNYAKQSWRPTFGGGRDIISDRYSARLQALYLLKGTDRQNGTQGVEIGFYMPSPATKGHFFFRETIQIVHFYDTVDPSATAQQIDMMKRHFTSYMTTGIMVRW